MKLTTYSVFCDRLRTVAEVVEVAKHSAVYFYDKGAWWDEGKREVDDIALGRFLTKSKIDKAEQFRPRNQKIGFFWVDALHAVVVINCNASLRANRLEKIAKAIATCYLDSKNQYDASHDPLTLLPNRKSFEDAIEARVVELGQTQTTSTSPIVGPITGGFTLLAFDLDHFKQINDTHGHPYGDVVLAAFAWRLANFAEYLEKSHQLKTHTARLGGEEFQLLIAGLVDEKSGIQFSNEFRQQVKNVAPPSDDEWRIIADRRGVSEEMLPPASERSLSVSIGHTLLTSTEAQSLLASMNTALRVSTALMQQADVALYCAKNDGRDCVRSFREIKDRLGKVLEHHTETGIVTIDIGTKVGVKAGMEFLVYHPQFYGNHPFYQSDGRTKKKLGTYPKYPSGRLTVFETSGEISFAQVIENKLQPFFTVGSRLEYVPLGSFTHLVTSPLERTQGNLANYDQLMDRTKELVGGGERIVAISLAIKDMESIVIARGTAHGNDILAAVFRSIRASLGAEALIAMTSATEFLVLTAYNPVGTAEDVYKLVESIASEVGKGAKCAAGVYDSKTIPMNIQRPEMAVECARLARSLNDQVNIFNAAAAASVIFNWRSMQAWEEGIADYVRLKNFGLSFADMENAAGLCYFERRPIPDYQSALQCFFLATEIARKDGGLQSQLTYYELNIAYTLAATGEHDDAIEIFRAYPISSGEKFEGMPPVYIAAYARSIYFQIKENKLSIPLDEAKLVLMEALSRGGDSLGQGWVGAIEHMIVSTLSGD